MMKFLQSFALGLAIPGLAGAASAMEWNFAHVVVDAKPPTDPWIKIVGDFDLVPGAQVWFENPGPGGDPARDGWRLHRISSIRTHDIEVVDIDGDGMPDIVARDQSGFGHNTGNRIHFWRQERADRWVHHALECPHGEGLAVTDLDRDGDPDVVLGGLWFENPGEITETWAKHTFTSDWTWGDAKVAVGDVNGDALVDVVLAPAELKGQTYRLAWYEAPEDPRRAAWTERIVMERIESVVHGMQVADMDRDGQADIVAAQMHQGAPPQQVSVFRNQNRGLNWAHYVVATTGSHDIQVADFDGDGCPDILGANHGGPYQPVELWLNRIAEQRAGGWSSPQPGDVFREYRWTHMEGDAGGALRVGGRHDYGGDAIALSHTLDLAQATRAEVVMEKLLCHDGTRGLAISINSNAWLRAPEAPRIPAPQWDYQHYIYPVVAVPLVHLQPALISFASRLTTNIHGIGPKTSSMEFTSVSTTTRPKNLIPPGESFHPGRVPRWGARLNWQPKPGARTVGFDASILSGAMKA